MVWTNTMRLKPKQSCVDCHFLVKKIKNPEIKSFEITESERDKASQGNYSWVVYGQLPPSSVRLACSFGVWDEMYDYNNDVLKERRHLIVEKNRWDFCFWWKYHPNMRPEAAEILQEREAKNRDSTRDRRLTLIGLWIAAIALVINVWLTLAQKLKLWPFN
ncbi:MAG: hypothetical protein A2069_05715 [Planctomycetes bacterium GWB2_41_19]|nr:MAG: hypothetical protein A2069_05715 [Planctomycetes bacterium GWB2_41_19]